MEVFLEPPIVVKAQNNGTDDKLHLTNIDQVRNHYRSVLFVYRSTGNELNEAADPAGAVRRGVEEAVDHYPWAAGRIRVVDHGIERHGLEVCYNEDGGPGVHFVSARANCGLAQLGDLADPNPAFEPLFAKVDMNAPLHSRPLVVLQVTRFDDGGVCVSMNWHHAVFDGAAASIFMQNICWCARGEGLYTHMDKAPRELRMKPVHDIRGWPACSDLLQEIYTKDLSTSNVPLPATRFNFSKEDVAQLRAEALSKQQDCGIGFKGCSRFQALAAHLWKAKAKSLICSKDLQLSDALPLRMPVNVRERIVANIPLNYMGNALSTVITSATLQELKEKSLAFAVEKIQEAIKQATSEHFQSEVNYLEMLGSSARLMPSCMAITSLLGLGWYETDFGWGKPYYFAHPHKQRRSLVIVSDGDAQYSSVNVLAVFDSQIELQKFEGALSL